MFTGGHNSLFSLIFTEKYFYCGASVFFRPSAGSGSVLRLIKVGKMGLPSGDMGNAAYC
ncbi:hypothetical protein D082_13840 [Synechocystis sp. PCC 6714]|nr:hypothetical protein D082_13840 [Synechocystis sp. PCC 6714]